MFFKLELFYKWFSYNLSYIFNTLSRRRLKISLGVRTTLIIVYLETPGHCTMRMAFSEAVAGNGTWHTFLLHQVSSGCCICLSCQIWFLCFEIPGLVAVRSCSSTSASGVLSPEPFYFDAFHWLCI